MSRPLQFSRALPLARARVFGIYCFQILQRKIGGMIMSKSITKIVLTGGPAGGKTTLVSRILKEFRQEDGWKVIIIPESATDLISGFGIRPFGNCVTMYDFQYFVTEDQLHREKLALKGAELVPEDKVIVIYDRAVFDNRGYVSDPEFDEIISHFGYTREELMRHYDAVIHLVTCAKGAEFAYNFGNAARYEDIATARQRDDDTLEAWSSHPARYIIDNSVDFDEKINRAMAQIYRILGQEMPQAEKRKYLIDMPDLQTLEEKYGAVKMDMMQNYLTSVNPNVERRIRQQKSGKDYLYFYTEKRTGEDGTKWVTEKPVAEKEYVAYLMEADVNLHPVRKTKYSFEWESKRVEIDVYPFSADKAVMFVYGPSNDPGKPGDIQVLAEVTGKPEYKNRNLALTQKL